MIMDTSAAGAPNNVQDPENAPDGSGAFPDSAGAKRATLSLELAGPAPQDAGGKGAHEIASSAIREAGGSLLRVSAASALASFATCGEALAAAISIQQRFLLMNQDNRGQVQGRIGIHFEKEKKRRIGNENHTTRRLSRRGECRRPYVQGHWPRHSALR